MWLLLLLLSATAVVVAVVVVVVLSMITPLKPVLERFVAILANLTKRKIRDENNNKTPTRAIKWDGITKVRANFGGTLMFSLASHGQSYVYPKHVVVVVVYFERPPTLAKNITTWAECILAHLFQAKLPLVIHENCSFLANPLSNIEINRSCMLLLSHVWTQNLKLQEKSRIY